MKGQSMSSGRSGRPGDRRGFTIAEGLIATILLGLGVVSLIVAAKSSTQVNAAGKEITEATYLAQEIREWTLKLPFSDPDLADKDNPPGQDGSDPQSFVDDLDDLMGVTYDPPRDGEGQLLHEMSGWSQTMTLTWRHPEDLQAVVFPGTSDIVFVEVDVSHEGKPVVKTGWLVTRREHE
jgi:hypothetical protein